MTRIDKLFDFAERCSGESEIAMATVVQLDGSNYARPGDRLLVNRAGDREGYISGGCLERELLSRIWAQTESGPTVMAFDTRGNAIQPGRYNSGCDGIVRVLCQRLHPVTSPLVQVWKQSLQKTGYAVGWLTVYRSESPLSQVGDQYCFDPVLGKWNPVGLESPPEDDLLLSRLQQDYHVSSIDRETPENLVFSDANGHEVCCLIQWLESPQRLIVIGSGDDVRPLYQMCFQMGWQVTVVGNSPSKATAERFPNAELCFGPHCEVIERLDFEPQTPVVMMTHDFQQDLQTLPILMRKSTGYVGILGPKRRIGKLVMSLHRQGTQLGSAEVERLRSPIGLDIGARSPEEIAVSILAEIIAYQRGRSGQPLHHRTQAIHDQTRVKHCRMVPGDSKGVVHNVSWLSPVSTTNASTPSICLSRS